MTNAYTTDELVDIGIRIAQARRNYTWSQLTLAKAVGLSETVVRKIEKAQRPSTTRDDLIGIGDVLGLTIEEILEPLPPLGPLGDVVEANAPPVEHEAAAAEDVIPDVEPAPEPREEVIPEERLLRLVVTNMTCPKCMSHHPSDPHCTMCNPNYAVRPEGCNTYRLCRDCSQYLDNLLRRRIWAAQEKAERNHLVVR